MICKSNVGNLVQFFDINNSVIFLLPLPPSVDEVLWLACLPICLSVCLSVCLSTRMT